MRVTIRGEEIVLLPECAAFWVAKKTLIVSDIHIGKAATLRKAGIAVPEGSMEEDLASLAKLIHKNKARHCIIVGDLIHSSRGLSECVKTALHTWLSELKCEVHLVFGNHDKPLIKNMPAEWNLHTYKEKLVMDPFLFCHLPTLSENHFVWSGHIHPKIVLSDGLDNLKLKCFFMTTNQCILPAFSTVVGGHLVTKDKDSRIFVTTGSEIIEV